MISMFQLPRSQKPVAKAVYAFDEESGNKWVPLNRSFVTLTKTVLQRAAARMEVESLAVTLRCITHQGYRHLMLTLDEQDLALGAFGAAEDFIISSEDIIAPLSAPLKESDAVSVTLDYHRQRLGYVVATLSHNHSGQSVLHSPRLIEAELHMVTAELCSIITRYQTRYRAIFIYGDQNYWVGNSQTLSELDKRIEQLGSLHQPVLIRGDRGTGKIIAAKTLHCIRHKSILPFIESSCNDWQEGAAKSILSSLKSYAKGGTLYLRNIDALSAENFKTLQQFCSMVKTEIKERGSSESVDIVLTTSSKKHVEKNQLSEWATANTLELKLPDLVDRREDIRDLVGFFSREYALSIDFDFTDHAWKLLESYHWKNNVHQLKSLMQKIALVVEEPLVSVSLLGPLLKD